MEIEQLKYKLYLADMERGLLKIGRDREGDMPTASEEHSSIPVYSGKQQGKWLQHILRLELIPPKDRLIGTVPQDIWEFVDFCRCVLSFLCRGM